MTRTTSEFEITLQNKPQNRGKTATALFLQILQELFPYAFLGLKVGVGFHLGKS
jgi:hypothetical protein